MKIHFGLQARIIHRPNTEIASLELGLSINLGYDDSVSPLLHSDIRD